jgi:hypothetical protein
MRLDTSRSNGRKKKYSVKYKKEREARLDKRRNRHDRKKQNRMRLVR